MDFELSVKKHPVTTGLCPMKSYLRFHVTHSELFCVYEGSKWGSLTFLIYKWKQAKKINQHCGSMGTK